MFEFLVQPKKPVTKLACPGCSFHLPVITSAGRYSVAGALAGLFTHSAREEHSRWFRRVAREQLGSPARVAGTEGRIIRSATTRTELGEWATNAYIAAVVACPSCGHHAVAFARREEVIKPNALGRLAERALGDWFKYGNDITGLNSEGNP